MVIGLRRCKAYVYVKRKKKAKMCNMILNLTKCAANITF